jgi:hypothetical protein
MKFNRKQLEQLTLEKIDEVNDEAGYRSYLEVPEMVEIISSIIEEKYMQIINETLGELPIWTSVAGPYIPETIPKRVKFLGEEFKLAEEIINNTLRELPVGNISTHTPESIPERVSYYLKELAEYTQRVEAWEKCADDLVDYAHEFVAHLSSWGKGYDRYDKDISKAEDAIEEYLRLKNETT